MKDWYVYTENHQLVNSFASYEEAVAWAKERLRQWLVYAGLRRAFLVHWNRKAGEGEWVRL